MALTDITTKILDDAKDHKAEIEQETEREIDQIKKETATEKERMDREHAAELDREKQHRLRQAQSLADQESKLANETTRRKHIDSVFTDVAKRLTELSSQDYQSFVTSCLKDLPSDATGVLSAPTDRMEETKKALAESGHDLTIQEDSSLSGGFRISDKKADYDYSFERLVNDLRGSHELEVASTLFSN